MTILPGFSRLAALVFLAFLCATGIACAEDLTVTIDGTERTVLIFAPEKIPAKAPVVFAFHGHGGTAKNSSELLNFQKAWPEAIVVYMQGVAGYKSPIDPKGEQPAWQRSPGEAGDRDLKFFDAVLAELHKKYPVDDNRIYAAGFSNGGFFVYLLWAERPKVFAAFAPCAAMLGPDTHPSTPRPIFCMAGKADEILPFEKQQAAIDLARQVNGCSAEGRAIGTGVTYYASKSKTPVVTLIHPGGHIWPGIATEVIVKFFKNHPGGE